MSKVKDVPRSVSFFRVATEQPGLMPKDRRFIPYKDAPSSTVDEIRGALKNLYDLVLLHDEKEGCLLLTLIKDTPEDQVLTKLPCQLHKKQ